ncbi:MAG: DUF4116 domain-containing protein [Limnobacter sp.]|nr:DUF4116 domain-containing protein [Limnobacter sp.]
MPSVKAREDFSLPGESVSLNLLDRLVWQFRGRVPVDDHLGSVCASLVMSSGNLHDMTAYQLIQVQEVLGAAAQPRTALVESATEKLRLAYLDKIKSNSLTFAWAPLAWRQDFDITLSAVKHHGNLLQYAPVDLKDNAVVVTAAVKNAAEAIQYASARLQDHEGIASLAVSGFGPTLFYLSARLKDTPAVVRLAIQENGMALQHASDRLRRDPQLIRLAIAQNPRAARFVL